MTWLLFGLIVWVALVVFFIIYPWLPSLRRQPPRHLNEPHWEPLPSPTSRVYKRVTDIDRRR